MRLVPFSPGTHFNLGVLHARTGRSCDGVSHFRRALALDPGYAKALGYYEAKRSVGCVG